MAKVLVIGSGGREHALVWKLSKSRDVESIIAAPGNAGIAQIAKCFDVNAENIEDLADLAMGEKVDLTVVGPEAPLVNGIVNCFEKYQLRTFGPHRLAALLTEGSKVKAKDFMRLHNIPTAEYRTTGDVTEALKLAEEFFKEYNGVVVKADGLATGKGVKVCKNLDDARTFVNEVMCTDKFKKGGDSVVIEEPLEGEEASFIAFTDGKTVKPLASSQDHKPAYDNDQGPNTGGMGAYAPVPIVKGLENRVMKEIMIPTVEGLAKMGIEYQYKGVLYAGLMITKDGPKVLEFNCRFGDPETQVNLPLLNTETGDDLCTIMNACIDGKLDKVNVDNFNDKHAVCVCIVSGGYPGDYEKGKEIFGLSNVDKGALIFHAGTKEKDGKIMTSGGRVLGITTVGNDLKETIKSAYDGVGEIKFGNGFGLEKGKYFYRTDIGWKGLKALIEK